MKTETQVIRNYPDYKKLISAVIEQLGGTDYVQDITRHGIDGGYPGFTYYSDTHEFAMKHRDIIIKLLEERADEMGTEVVEMVSHFGVFRKNKMDNTDKKELYKFLGGGTCEQSHITNLMAWFAAEEVCRMFDE